MSIPPNIALAGRTGAGKSTAADYLAATYGYHAAKPGAACREIAQRLFGTQAKTVLNQVNDAMRAIDSNVNGVLPPNWSGLFLDRPDLL